MVQYRGWKKWGAKVPNSHPNGCFTETCIPFDAPVKKLYKFVACENSRPSTLPAQVAFRVAGESEYPTMKLPQIGYQKDEEALIITLSRRRSPSPKWLALVHTA